MAKSYKKLVCMLAYLPAVMFFYGTNIWATEVKGDSTPYSQSHQFRLSRHHNSRLINGSSWLLVRMVKNGQQLSRAQIGDRVTLSFESGGRGVSGSGGCNNYGGSARLESDYIFFSNMVSGQRYCSQEIMAIEQMFFESLSLVTEFRQIDQQHLMIRDLDKKVILEFTNTKSVSQY